MKKVVFTTLVVVLALGVAGCGGEDSEEVSNVPFDRAFIDAMVPHHQSAIDMAREAKKAGLEQPELVKIADDIIATQRAEIDQMLAWRELWFGSKRREPEDAALEVLGLSAAEAGMEHGAGGLAGADDVNQAFAGMMIGHHTGAIRMARLAQERGEHAELQTFAGDIIAAQQREIDIMESFFKGGHG
jgi:predicted outer membrane protein